jgi:hypothetical protein
VKQGGRIAPRMKCWKTALSIFALSASLALADDFKTINGKEYKNAAVTRVEPDGIVIKFHSGIAKLQFTELPSDVQKKYGYDPLAAREYATQRDRVIPRPNEDAGKPSRMTLDSILEHQVSLENSVVEVQFDFRVAALMKEDDPGWFKTVIGIGGREYAIMDALVPKAGVSWFESVPPERKALFPQYVFARVEKYSSGIYFLRLLGTRVSPDGRFDW